jgi:hypothetical protein
MAMAMTPSSSDTYEPRHGKSFGPASCNDVQKPLHTCYVSSAATDDR